MGREYLQLIFRLTYREIVVYRAINSAGEGKAEIILFQKMSETLNILYFLS